MSEYQNRVIHFGNSITQSIINHQINLEIWQSFYNSVQNLSIWTHQRINREIKVYHYEGLIYEYDKQSGQYMCYLDEHHQLKMMKINNDNHALTYILHRKNFNELDFQPINKYYNVYEMQRSEFHNELLTVIFEKKGHNHEIKLVCSDINQCQIEQILKQIMEITSVQLFDLEY